MDYTQNQQQAVPQAPADIRENTGAGPLAPPAAGSTYGYAAWRLRSRSRLERVGYWVVVVAALALLLVLLGVFLPRFVNGAILGFNIGLFVAILGIVMYNVFVTRVDNFNYMMDEASYEVLQLLAASASDRK